MRIKQQKVLWTLIGITLGIALPLSAYAETVNYSGDKNQLRQDYIDTSELSLYPTSSNSGNTININVPSPNINEAPYNVFGAYSSAGSVNGNTVNFKSGIVKNFIYGGYSAEGSATNNTVNMSGGEADNIVAGYTFGMSGNATGNIINISGGEVINVVAGEANGSGVASNNKITITGGYISEYMSGHIYGGRTISGSANNNIITISGDAKLGTQVSIAGGYSVNPNLSTTAGNILNWGIISKVSSVSNFEYYNFTIPADAQSGSTLLEAKTSLDGAKIKVVGVSTQDQWLGSRSFVLIKDPQGSISGTPILIDGKVPVGARTYEYKLTQETDSIVADVGKVGGIGGAAVGEHAKSFSEARIASLSFINSAADLAAGNGLQIAVDTSSSTYDIFGAVNYADNKLKTGAGTDLKGTSLLLGASRRLKVQNGYWTLGAFFESGWSKYNTTSYFADIDRDVNANGKSNYFGGGLLARNIRDNGLYMEGSVRIGRISTDYESFDTNNKYDTKSTYYGLHLGLGKLIKIGKNQEVDVYGKYFWSHQNAASAVIMGDKINFDSLDSNRVRVGARLNMFGNKGVKTYVGMAYEYEFSASAGSTILDSVVAAPTIKGGTGIGEIGLVYKPTAKSAFSMDVALNGYIGKRQGIGGGLRLNWGF